MSTTVSIGLGAGRSSKDGASSFGARSPRLPFALRAPRVGPLAAHVLKAFGGLPHDLIGIRGLVGANEGLHCRRRAAALAVRCGGVHVSKRNLSTVPSSTTSPQRVAFATATAAHAFSACGTRLVAVHVVLLPLAMVLLAVAAVEAPAPLRLGQLVGACALGPHEARRDEDARHGGTGGLG